MPYPGQRTGFRASRGILVLLAIGVALFGVALWVGPFRPIPPELRLLVGADTAAGPAREPLPNLGPADAPRFALVLSLQNEGGRAARPARLDLSVPAMFRVRSNRTDVQREAVPGNPLVRYRIPIPERNVRPDGRVHPIAPGDTIWLEPSLDDYYCTAMADSVPEFVPAPARHPAQLARVDVFYSLAEARGTRQAGVLQLQLDSSALRYTPAARPPASRVVVREPEMPRPELGELREGGSRTALCGDPQQPLELYTVLWETASGGRFLVVYLNGAPRKHLYDLDRDSIIELEMWDPNSDGRFEAARAARYPIPPFLLPERVALETPGGLALPTDSLDDGAWQRLFDDTAAGPFRFVPDSLLPDALRPRVVVTDSAWLRRFHDTAAGPYRFAENPPPRLVQPPPPPPQRPRGPVPLGRPVPYPAPPGRPDTIPG